MTKDCGEKVLLCDICFCLRRIGVVLLCEFGRFGEVNPCVEDENMNRMQSISVRKSLIFYDSLRVNE